MPAPVLPSIPIAPARRTCRSSPTEVKMILDGVGLMGSDDHTVNETADLQTLPSQTKRAAVFLLRLARSCADNFQRPTSKA